MAGALFRLGGCLELADGHKVARVILAELALGVVGNDGGKLVAGAVLIAPTAVDGQVAKTVAVEANEQPATLKE